MNRVVVDTDVVSFLFKDHPLASRYDADLIGRTLVISFMTVAELDRWTIQARWSEARRNRLQQYLEPFVVLPYDRELCRSWAEITVTAQAQGHRIECADAWIADTALLYNLPLITHNRAHYIGVPGVTLISHGL